MQPTRQKISILKPCKPASISEQNVVDIMWQTVLAGEVLTRCPTPHFKRACLGSICPHCMPTPSWGCGLDTGSLEPPHVSSPLPCLAGPVRVRDVLASRACRTSIMIGSPLTRKQQGRILARLAQLDAPFNCPHGRPTMRHLAVLPTEEQRPGQQQPSNPGPT